MNTRVATFAGIVSILLLVEFWVHYVVLFRYEIGYPLGLNGIFISMLLAFIGGLVASARRRPWALCSVAAAASFVFIMAHIH